tara:strand:- start:4173 stop:4406 length:234 start_codon:yes stop_codon:yes gene_type:complete
MKQKLVNELNLKGEVCPMTFVKTKLAIEKLNSGEKLKVIFNSSEAKINVPKSLKELNYKVITINDVDENNFYIIVEK